jgi:hypothetical protein
MLEVGDGQTIGSSSGGAQFRPLYRRLISTTTGKERASYEADTFSRCTGPYHLQRVSKYTFLCQQPPHRESSGRASSLSKFLLASDICSSVSPLVPYSFHRAMISFMMRSFLILTYAISFVLSADVCYWPNGQLATQGMLPCTSIDSRLTQCCAQNEACLSNGMCFAAGGGGVCPS